MSIFNDIQNKVQLTIKSTPAPTPLVQGQLMKVSPLGLDFCKTSIEIEQITIGSNFLEFDTTPWAQRYTAGTTNLNQEGKISYGVKKFMNRNPFDPWQLKAAACGNLNWLTETTMSALLAWDAMNEAAAVYGIPQLGVSGLLWGSGIPQAVETLNYFDGSLNGVQLVDAVMKWVDRVHYATQFRYRSNVIGMPPKLVKVLNDTLYITGQTANCLSILKDRISGSLSKPELVSITSFNDLNIMAFIDDDVEKIALCRTELASETHSSQLDFAGVAGGVIALHPYSHLIVRLPG